MKLDEYNESQFKERIENNRRKSPANSVSKARGYRSLTENSFLRNRARSQQKEFAPVNTSARDIANKSDIIPDQASQNTEYTDENLKREKIKSRIKMVVNNRLVNGDVKSLKSLKLLLRRTNKFLNQAKQSLNKNIKIESNPYSQQLNASIEENKNMTNVSTKAILDTSDSIDNELGFAWGYLNDSMKEIENKAINLKNEPNSFLKPMRFPF